MPSSKSKRSQEFHKLNFECKRLLEFVERYSDGVDIDPCQQCCPVNKARVDFLVNTGWLTTKYIGCQGDKLRYIRTSKQ